MAEFTLTIPIHVEGTGPKVISPKFEIKYSVTYPELADAEVGKSHDLWLRYSVAATTALRVTLTTAKNTTLTGTVTSNPISIRTKEDLGHVSCSIEIPSINDLKIKADPNNAIIKFFDGGGNLVAQRNVSDDIKDKHTFGYAGISDVRLPTRATITLVQLLCNITFY